ncbi:MAG: hypothetical protein NT056_04780 [Proteobacteria bacterium]|nr:hypothetical protein [Pseudomonadota bacterium]
MEVAPVTDEELEKTLNRWTGEGYHFVGIQFAMRESSPRPANWIGFSASSPRCSG